MALAFFCRGQCFGIYIIFTQLFVFYCFVCPPPCDGKDCESTHRTDPTEKMPLATLRLLLTYRPLLPR